MSSAEPVIPHPAGSVIGGRYEVESLIGQGGMGSVWRAKHTTLHTPVALKFIDPKLLDEAGVQARFMVEARSAAALRSSHIVQVFDFGVENGVPYIAMEMLFGKSLAEHIEKGPISPADTAVILSEMSRAMGYAHEQKVIHRDLKPENVFLSNESGNQVTKVLDFGVAKVAGTMKPVTLSGSTQSGSLLGTPYYVSPEQARGNKEVDHRSDLWAMGIIVYECLTGKKPFDSDGLGDLLMMICNDPYRPLKDLALGSVVTGDDVQSEALEAWFSQALAKDPDDRFQSARQMADSFHQMVFGEKRPSYIDLSPDDHGEETGSIPDIEESGKYKTSSGTVQSIPPPPTLPDFTTLPTYPPLPGPAKTHFRSELWKRLNLAKHLEQWNHLERSKRQIVVGAAGLVFLGGLVLAFARGEEAAPSNVNPKATQVSDQGPMLESQPENTALRIEDVKELEETEESDSDPVASRQVPKETEAVPVRKLSTPPVKQTTKRSPKQPAKSSVPTAEAAFGDRK